MIDLRSLTLKQLRALARTVQTGSVTGAAKALHVTPPAISTQLKTLEKLVGAPLFERAGQGFAPTEVGSELLDAALDVEQLIGRAGERIAALRSGAAGSVVFGVVSTGKYFAPGIVAQFQKANPKIRVMLAIGNRQEIVRGLERNEYDLLIMGRPPAHVPVVSTVLSDHPHVLIAAPDHPLASKAELLVEDLLPERFLAREPGSGTRMLMSRFLERIGGGLMFDLVEMGTNETIKQAVMAGLGIAIISAHTCSAELQDQRLIALPMSGLPLMRQWFLLHPQGRPLTTAAEILKSFIIENRQNIIPNLA